MANNERPITATSASSKDAPPESPAIPAEKPQSVFADPDFEQVIEGARTILRCKQCGIAMESVNATRHPH
jgi:hypothetical protein